MKFLLLYLREKQKVFCCFFLFSAIFLVVFHLYELPLNAVLYPTLLCALLGILFLIPDLIHKLRKHRLICSLSVMSDSLIEDLPAPEKPSDRDYQELIRLIWEENRAIKDSADASFQATVEYYTLWAHQIKTPISSMRLKLSGEDSPLARELLTDLFHIEQYVEMVLTFLRLDSDTTDYCIRSYSLDEMIRRSLKKFAGEFIHRKLTLHYTPTDITVITDEKWLSFVIEQVLSNALKYTVTGGIDVYMEEPKILCIRDSGIGISEEDLPRIFERGFTGCNGRTDHRASGIGLYLCRRICKNLGFRIYAESEPDKGTIMRIDLTQRKTFFE